MKQAVVKWLRNFVSASYSAPHKIPYAIAMGFLVLIGKSKRLERRDIPGVLTAAIVAIPFNIMIHLTWLVFYPFWAFKEYVLDDVDWR